MNSDQPLTPSGLTLRELHSGHSHRIQSQNAYVLGALEYSLVNRSQLGVYVLSPNVTINSAATTERSSSEFLDG